MDAAALALLLLLKTLLTVVLLAPTLVAAHLLLTIWTLEVSILVSSGVSRYLSGATFGKRYI